MTTFQCQRLDKFDFLTCSDAVVGKNLSVNIEQTPTFKLLFTCKNEKIQEIEYDANLEVGRISGNVASIFTTAAGTLFCHFDSAVETSEFIKAVRSTFNSYKNQMDASSDFEKRTDEASAVQYFQFYSYLSQQQNMMQDYIRTSTYQKAIQMNAIADFRGKVVLDVGAGSGILSFFAAQAGAAKVYAVEASNMASHCETLVQNNKMAGRIIVVSGRIEDVEIPEPVDIIISEPMGYMLFNERMLETYVHARKFLAKKYRIPVLDENGRPTEEISNTALQRQGLMYPSVAHMYIVPFSDEALFTEQHTKANFWYQQSFHGMDLSSLRQAAISEYFNQPIVDTFDIEICPALPVFHKVDFRTVEEAELANIEIPLAFKIHTSSTIHGLAFWFDVGFLGTHRDVWLSTSPTEPLTHWYQVRCLIGSALYVQQDQILRGMLRMRANKRQSYDVDIELIVPGTSTRLKNTLDLKNPYFRYTGYPAAPPPGCHSKAPTDNFINNIIKSQKPVVSYEGDSVVTNACGDFTLWPGGNPVSLKEMEQLDQGQQQQANNNFERKEQITTNNPSSEEKPIADF